MIGERGVSPLILFGGPTMATDLSEPVEAVEDERVYPPFWIKRLQIRNFKSIEFADFTLEPLTVFVGRNGAGKSNVLDAIGFIRALIGGGLSRALANYAGSDAICRIGSGEPISLSVWASCMSKDGDQCEFSWSTEIAFDEPTPRITLEQFELENSVTGEAYHWDVDSVVDLFGIRNAEGASGLRKTLMEIPSINFVMEDSAVRALSSLKSISIYRPDPSSIRDFTRPVEAETLASNTSNAAQILLALEQLDPSSFNRVREWLGIIVPGIEDVRGVAYGPSLVDLTFSLEHGDVTIKMSGSRMSDGTLRALATLLAVSQRWREPVRLRSKAFTTDIVSPSLVAIEEPETSLHPAALHALIEAFDEATSHTQVLLTTHNADWLAEPPITLDQIRVVEMIDGKTVVAPIDSANRLNIEHQLRTLADLQNQAHLRPDPDDLDRQRDLAAGS